MCVTVCVCVCVRVRGCVCVSHTHAAGGLQGILQQCSRCVCVPEACDEVCVCEEQREKPDAQQH